MIDFRSFRTMHSSLMLRQGACPEVVRDNMGHANIDVTQNVYGKSWWEERKNAVTSIVDAVFAEESEFREERAEPEAELVATVSSEAEDWVPLNGSPNSISALQVNGTRENIGRP
jgi:hypothetical protein